MENNSIEILYLDDEVENLIGFKASFRRYYKIHTASSTYEALDILNKNDIHIILIDQNMPSINGVEFLQLISEDFPDAIKIILSGCIDHKESIIESMSTANVYRCISKPWIENDIRITVEDAYRVYCFKKQKGQELQLFKNELSSNIKTPIENLEELLSRAKNEIKDEYAVSNHLKEMNSIIDKLKVDLNELSN